MLKTNNIETFNWEGALRGMRNPMNSWGKSDSEFAFDDCIIGPNDLSLCKRLCKAGSDHRKFVRQIDVSLDITAPLYWWKEFDTYKVGTVSNSCSTMHKIMSRDFTVADFSTEKMIVYAKHQNEKTIYALNTLRNMYFDGEHEAIKKEIWYSIIQLLPSSYNQKRTITLNYEVAYNMYQARKSHKLEEWHVLCNAFIRELPYFADMFGITAT